MEGEDGEEGLLFVGDKGKILCGFNGARPRLIPDAKMKAFQPPPKTLPRSPGNEREWLDAAIGGKTKPGGNFEFSALVTETLLLGNVASRTGQKLKGIAPISKSRIPKPPTRSSSPTSPRLEL